MDGLDRKKKAADAARRNRAVASGCVMGVAAMAGLAYASVPLYQLFCQVTGYGGTTQVAERASETVTGRDITIRFDANVSRTLGWAFKPAQKALKLKVGENALAFYEARNLTGHKIAGTATFNVTPQAAGQYFNKTECFCFTEQVLKPGERTDMPVAFFVDPALLKDKNLKNLKTITLSYTFYPLPKTAQARAGRANTTTAAR